MILLIAITIRMLLLNVTVDKVTLLVLQKLLLLNLPKNLPNQENSLQFLLSTLLAIQLFKNKFSEEILDQSFQEIVHLIVPVKPEPYGELLCTTVILRFVGLPSIQELSTTQEEQLKLLLDGLLRNFTELKIKESFLKSMTTQLNEPFRFADLILSLYNWLSISKKETWKKIFNLQFPQHQNSKRTSFLSFNKMNLKLLNLSQFSNGLNLKTSNLKEKIKTYSP